MNRNNLFKSLTDKSLAECYRDYIHNIKEKNFISDNDIMINIYNQYKDNLEEKYVKVIMDSDLLHEIGFRWCNIVENDLIFKL